MRYATSEAQRRCEPIGEWKLTGGRAMKAALDPIAGLGDCDSTRYVSSVELASVSAFTQSISRSNLNLHHSQNLTTIVSNLDFVMAQAAIGRAQKPLLVSTGLQQLPCDRSYHCCALPKRGSTPTPKSLPNLSCLPWITLSRSTGAHLERSSLDVDPGPRVRSMQVHSVRLTFGTQQIYGAQGRSC
ncbi:hypothetical protein CC78DRAFT_581554 [Lojkania enalia]|uniref:Uncharacterized protein n=1 Tax=Lojkania enalia TaxID=147567 RepID=A0A9P4K7F1_9PLEO|nr:hypothetical protein CC78DRAFT_581554 [Didymosphaeria enalia]